MSHELTALLAMQLARAPQGPLRVAFSGGPDSCALLHALSLLPQARARDLRALHVDHGLRAESAHWAAQCLDFCAQWRIPLELLTVRVPRDSGAGLEAAARAARYAAL
ncbi:ATP-binding protein, partial [Metallibacterium sp.]